MHEFRLILSWSFEKGVYFFLPTLSVSIRFRLLYQWKIKDLNINGELQTLVFFLKDKAKKFVVSLIITAPIVAIVVYIVERGGPYFFLYVWIFLSFAILVSIFFLSKRLEFLQNKFNICQLQLLMTVYTEYIAPLFDKYVPLPESELKRKIEDLARKIKFPLKKLLVVNGKVVAEFVSLLFY